MMSTTDPRPTGYDPLTSTLSALSWLIGWCKGRGIAPPAWVGDVRSRAESALERSGKGKRVAPDLPRETFPSIGGTVSRVPDPQADLAAAFDAGLNSYYGHVEHETRGNAELAARAVLDALGIIPILDALIHDGDPGDWEAAELKAATVIDLYEGRT